MSRRSTYPARRSRGCASTTAGKRTSRSSSLRTEDMGWTSAIGWRERNEVCVARDVTDRRSVRQAPRLARRVFFPGFTKSGQDFEKTVSSPAVRIASLLPSATEIVCALGARSQLVGRSHECDFPPGLEDVAVLTSARVGPLPSSKAIDASVRSVLRDALAIYDIDVEGLRAARPDVIVTQDLCEVCAVSLHDVRAAVARLARQDVAIVNLHPMRLEDIWGDIARAADAIGRCAAGARLVAELRARVADIARRAAMARARPRGVTIEWIAPVMVGGMWMPELIALPGGEALVTRPGQHPPPRGPARPA